MAGGIDKSPFQRGFSPHSPIGGIVNDSTPDTVPESAEAAARITPFRGFHVNLRDQAGNELSPNGALALTIKYAFSNVAASSTDSSIVASVSTKKIKVLEFRIHAGATATNITFNSKGGGAGTAITELFACAANGGRADGLNSFGHFQTNTSEALTVTTGAGSTIGVGVVYQEV